jgi:hypothetical protein
VYTGPAGTATEVVGTLEPDDPPDWRGTVATWFLDCPGQSPAWRHYLLFVIHLRPIEGVRPAEIRVPHATHEVYLFALDPQPGPTPMDVKAWRFLRPQNVMEQVQLPHDEAASELAGLAAKAVVEGKLPAEPPLSGAKEPWRTSVLQTAAHLRGEEHAIAPDTRIVYGARCTWWDSITEVAKHPSGLPCCPHCRGVLYEMASEAEWWAAVDQFGLSNPDYRAFIEWLRGRCFPNYESARAAFEAGVT